MEQEELVHLRERQGVGKGHQGDHTDLDERMSFLKCLSYFTKCTLFHTNLSECNRHIHTSCKLEFNSEATTNL